MFSTEVEGKEGVPPSPGAQVGFGDLVDCQAVSWEYGGREASVAAKRARGGLRFLIASVLVASRSGVDADSDMFSFYNS